MSDLTHGGALDAMRTAFPAAPGPWLDLSTGINPWPYPVKLSPEHMARLPDADLERSAREAAARFFGASTDCVALTPGSQAAIQMLPRLTGAKKPAILQPAYGGHVEAWRASGVSLQEVRVPRPEHDALIVVNPNNPTGITVSASALATLATRGGHLIVDEAFAEIAPGVSCAAQAGAAGLIVLRSFGKFFGLAGLRLGTLLSTPDLIQRAREMMGPWPVSGPALEAAAQAYGDTAWIDATRARLVDAAAKLDDVLKRRGLAVEGGTALFRFVRCDAPVLWARLARAGIYARRFAWSTTHLRFGLPLDDAALERLEAAL